MSVKRSLICQTSNIDIKAEDCEVVTEGASIFLKLKGVFSEADAVNSNRRVYPKKILAREVKKFQTKINQGKSLGKSYHPGFWDFGGGGAQNVAVRVLSLEMEGTLANGTLRVLDTVDGKDIQAIVDGGGRVGISSRGWGSSKREDWKNPKTGRVSKNVSVIQDDFELETYDIVLTPSVTKAMLKVSEQLDSVRMKVEENVLEDNSAFEFNLEEGAAQVRVGTRSINETVKPVSATFGDGTTYKYDSISGHWYEGAEIVLNEKEEEQQEEIEIMDREKLKKEFPDTYSAIERLGYDEGKKSVGPVLLDKDEHIAKKQKELDETKASLEKSEKDLAESKKTLDVTNQKYKELDEKFQASEKSKVAIEVKAFVDKRVTDSKFKSVIKDEDLPELYACETKDKAGKAFDKFETYLTRITKQVSESLGGEGKLPIPDALDESDKDKANKAYVEEQRALAGL